MIRLPNFEGPFDLLLFLIKKDEIDIYDIPIAEITRQYLEYIELMRELNLEVAGEFILMAATLIQIKVRMLLPKPEIEEDEEEEDLRATLVQQLLEYKRFKEVSEALRDIEERQCRFYPRSYFNWLRRYEKGIDGEFDDSVLRDVTLFDLLKAFKSVIDNMPKVTSHEVKAPVATIDEQIDYVLGELSKSEKIAFSDLMKRLKDRVVIIVTFLAVLELIRTHKILLHQASLFGEIWLQRRT